MRHEAWFGDRVVVTFHPRPASVWAMFAGAAQRTPQAEALVCGTTRLTYADCDAASARLCAGLASQGIHPGDRVLLFIDNRPEFVLALLALQRLGAIAVPVGVREQRPGLAYIARQCGAAAILIDAHGNSGRTSDLILCGHGQGWQVGEVVLVGREIAQA
jgi:long-chain acyl-CoA synthetase